MEDFILDLLESIGNIDFRFVWQIFLYALLLFWIVVLYWVWLDSGDRTSKKIVRFSYVLLVAVLSIIGLLIYLIIRPGQTIEEIYWADLERRYLKYETAELGDCPKCGRQLFPGYTFCPNCRYKLKKKCNRCQVFVDKDDKFCPHCGNEMKKRKSPEETSPTKEVMQEQIRATKEKATEIVESKKTRYSTKGGLAIKLGESIVGGYKILYKKLRNVFIKTKETVIPSKEEEREIATEQRKEFSKKSKKESKRRRKKKDKKSRK